MRRPDSTKEILRVTFCMVVTATTRTLDAMLEHVIATYVIGNTRCINLFQCKLTSNLFSCLFMCRAFERHEFMTVLKLNHLIEVNAFVSTHSYCIFTLLTMSQFMFLMTSDSLDVLDILAKNILMLSKFTDSPFEEVLQDVI